MVLMENLYLAQSGPSQEHVFSCELRCWAHDMISLFPEPSSLQALRSPVLLHKSIFHDWTARDLEFEEFRKNH